MLNEKEDLVKSKDYSEKNQVNLGLDVSIK